MGYIPFEFTVVKFHKIREGTWFSQHWQIQEGHMGCVPTPCPISFIFMQFLAQILSNKNAFQWDAYRPQQ